jgi:hypothetical protein
VSDGLAIASVTAVLRGVLREAVMSSPAAPLLGDVAVSALPPDRVSVEGAEPTRLNIFLFRVSASAAWRGLDAPKHSTAGQRTTNAPLALDLNYLLSAHGRNDLEAEMLLGLGMRALDERPVLGEEVIADVLGAGDDDTLPPAVRAATASLANQVDRIRVTLEPLDLETQTQLWSSFQTGQRPSAHYRVSAVLLQSQRPVLGTRPVRVAAVTTFIHRRPRVRLVLSLPAGAAPDADPAFARAILPGDRLVLTGSSLRGTRTLVRIDGRDIDAAIAEDERVAADIPADIRAGPKTIQVVHRILLASGEERPGPSSNAASADIRPVIAPGAGSIRVTPPTDAATDPRRRIEVDFAHPVGKRQDGVVLLTGVPGGGADTISAAFGAENWPSPANAELTTIGFPFEGLPAGRYALRAQIDGVESVGQTDAEGRLIGPEVQL